MLRQLLTNGNEAKDTLKPDGYYSSSPATFLIKNSPNQTTDVIFTSVQPSFDNDDVRQKNGLAYSPSYSLELCANQSLNEALSDIVVLLIGHISGTTELFSSTFAMLSADGVMPDSGWSEQSGQQKLVPLMYTINGAQGQSTEFNQPYAQQQNVQVGTHCYGQTSRKQQQQQQQYLGTSVENLNAQSLRNDNLYYQSQLNNCENLSNSETSSSSSVILNPTIASSSSVPLASGVTTTITTATTTCPNNIQSYSTNLLPLQPQPQPSLQPQHQQQLPYFQSFQDLSQIPVSSGANSGRNTPQVDNENETDERVMCVACRGVYPSRRSLTGHIGRNEKCREIIGRNYLDQLGGCSDKVSITGGLSGGVGSAESISPICPYCDRFISHYKLIISNTGFFEGNIRRHINQCLKSNKSRTKKPSNRKQDPKLSGSSSYTSPYDTYDGYQPHMLATGSGSCDFQWDPSASSMCNASSSATLQQPTTSPPQTVSHCKDGKNNDDPYLCSVCDFVTVYKGNMKRHLSTCHSIMEEDLGDGGLDSLRASRRTGDVHTRIGKVSRGRRPKSVQLQDECRKKAKLELLKCSSPAISENTLTSMDKKSPASSTGNIVEGFGDSNSNCSSSVQEHFRPTELELILMAERNQFVGYICTALKLALISNVAAEHDHDCQLEQSSTVTSTDLLSATVTDSSSACTAVYTTTDVAVATESSAIVTAATTTATATATATTTVTANQQQQQSCDIGNSDNCIRNNVYSVDNVSLIDDELNQSTGTATSTNNIDEIINAVAANQLGNNSKKSFKQGRILKTASRRLTAPKSVCNMDEVRNYWEAERLSSNSLNSSYVPRIRSAHLSATSTASITSQIPPKTVGTPYQP
uniref:C2H2-type domain-containing protein n=1 Tax=Syphacia muris TaxID=451379 RepID=A0A0N5AYY5_9BILA